MSLSRETCSAEQHDTRKKISSGNIGALETKKKNVLSPTRDQNLVYYYARVFIRISVQDEASDQKKIKEPGKQKRANKDSRSSVLR